MPIQEQLIFPELTCSDFCKFHDVSLDYYILVGVHAFSKRPDEDIFDNLRRHVPENARAVVNFRQVHTSLEHSLYSGRLQISQYAGGVALIPRGEKTTKDTIFEKILIGVTAQEYLASEGKHHFQYFAQAIHAYSIKPDENIFQLFANKISTGAEVILASPPSMTLFTHGVFMGAKRTLMHASGTALVPR